MGPYDSWFRYPCSGDAGASCPEPGFDCDLRASPKCPVIRREQRSVERAAARGIPRRLLPFFGLPVRDDSGQRVPPRDLLDTESLEHVRDWLAGTSAFLVLAGSLGTGKSLAAAYAVNAWRAPALYLRGFDLARRGLFGDANREQWDDLEKVPLLAVDDFDRAFDDRSGFNRTVVDGLLDARYDNKTRTILTSNLALDDSTGSLPSRLGSRTWDRIGETGRVFYCAGASLRRPRAN
jgi:hypothetical protein